MSNSIQIQKFSIVGMHCAACELWIEFETKKIPGVVSVKASNESGEISVDFDDNVVSLKDLQTQLHSVISQRGYELVFSENLANKPKSISSKFDTILDYLLAFLVAVILAYAYKMFLASGSIKTDSSSLSILTILAIGLVASFSQCGITIGSIIVGWAANYRKNNPGDNTKLNFLIGAFHVSRIVAFFILGGLLGFLGEAFLISATLTNILELFSLVIIFILALSLLDVSYILDRIIPKIPKKFTLKIFKLEGSKNVLAPIMIGALSFFIPCGFTSAMQLYSLKSGNIATGSLTMGVFAIGTFPVILLIGYFSDKFADSKYKYFFFKVVAFAMVFYSISGFLNLINIYI